MSNRRFITRLMIPDSHGAHIDMRVRAAILGDIKAIKPEQIIWGGDHLDCGGTFSSHQRTYTNEMAESYEDDCAAANSFLDAVQKASPDSENDYLEGNHEQHVERWAARNLERKKDAEALLEVWGPAKRLRLKERGFKYYKRSEHYQGISIPGTIRKGKCFYVHGICHGRHATSVHLDRFGACVVHFHTHRAAEARGRTVASSALGAWCPGTLVKLQPLYRHTAPSEWSHGYGLQFVAPSGAFTHWNVPILPGGESLLLQTIDAISRRKRAA